MKLFAIVAVAAAVLSAIVFAQKPAATEKGWYTDFNKAVAAAKKQNKLLLVDFNATWCGPCQMYKREVFPKSNFQRESKRLILVTIDTDEQPALAQKYGVNGIPDIRIMTPAGKEVGKIVGYGGEGPLLEQIKKAHSASKL